MKAKTIELNNGHQDLDTLYQWNIADQAPLSSTIVFFHKEFHDYMKTTVYKFRTFRKHR